MGLPSSGQDSQMRLEATCLLPTRQTVATADIDFDCNTGDALIVTSGSDVTSQITCRKVSMKIESAVLTLNVSHLPSFHANCQSTNSGYSISCVKFLQSDTAPALVVACGDSQSSQVELWQQEMTPVAVHSLFASPSDRTHSHLTWSYKSSVLHASLPVTVAVPLFCVRHHNLDPTAKLFQCVAVAYKDGSIKIISRPSFQAVMTTNLDMGLYDVEHSEKEHRFIVSLRQTFTGCGLVGFDQSGASLKH